MGLADDLRKSVLQAAIQGKLVPQDPHDEPARVLLERIKAEKEKLIDEKKIKKEKPIEPIIQDEVPFDIPDSWEWVKLGDVIILISGQDYSPHQYNDINQGIPYMTGASNFTDDGLIINRWTPVPRCIANNGDILLICKGSGYGKTIICDVAEIHIARQIMAIKKTDYLNMTYIMCYLQAMFDEIKRKGQGVIPGVDRGSINNLIYPLPPLAEQHRIVTKVEELMAKVSEFEAIEKELESLKKSFPEDLKKSLLQAAIRGKLTDQLSTDSSVDELLESIKKEKQQLIKDKKIKKEKDLPPISEDEIPFDIPENWRWVRLKDITYNWGQKTPNTDFCYIDVSSIDNKNNRLGHGETIISASEAPSRARKIVNFGDVIYATVRPYLHNVCIVDRDFSREPIVSTAFAVMHTCDGILNSYLFRYLLSPTFDSYANNSENSKGVAYPAINDERLYRAPVPIPPIEEQFRIVEKLDQLLPCCEGLG